MMNPLYEPVSQGHPVLENGVFWIALILLSLGAITIFHYQDQNVLTAISPHIYQTASAPADNVPDKTLTLYDADTGKPRTVISLDEAGVP